MLSEGPLNLDVIVGEDDAGDEALQDASFLVFISEVPDLGSVRDKSLRKVKRCDLIFYHRSEIEDAMCEQDEMNDERMSAIEDAVCELDSLVSTLAISEGGTN